MTLRTWKLTEVSNPDPHMCTKKSNKDKSTFYDFGVGLFVAFIFPFSPHFSQFYKCFLILFHCDHWSADNGNTSMPSKTTVIPLNRRGYSNTVACTAQISTEPLNPCCSTPATKHTTPPKGSTWAWINLNWAKTKNAAQVKEERLNVKANLMTSNNKMWTKPWSIQKSKCTCVWPCACAGRILFFVSI